MATVKGMGILEDDININIEDLQQISFNLGMTSKDWDLVLKEAEKRLELAKDHFDRKSFRNCILTCEEAQLLNPFINGVRGLKAKCFLLLAINENDDSYLPKAEKQAQLTLSKEPKDKNALEVIATISSKKRVKKASSENKPTKMIIIALIAFVILGMGIGMFVFRSDSSEDSLAYQKVEMIEKQLESAFEKHEALIPKVMSLIPNNLEGEQQKNKIKDIQSKLSDSNLSIKEKYEFHEELGKVLSAIIYGKSSENDTEMLKDLRTLLEGIENRIKTERKNYNNAVMEFNSQNTNSKFEKL